MQYEIIEGNAALGQITVRFTDDVGNALAFYSMDVPINNGEYLSGDALVQEIMKYAPQHILARREVVANANLQSFDTILASIQKTPEQIKADKIAAINKIKQEKLTGGFVHNGVAYPCDSIFQQQLTAFIVTWESGVLPPEATVTIRTFDDQLTQLSWPSAKELAAAVMVYVQSIYAESWAAKDALA